MVRLTLAALLLMLANDAHALTLTPVEDARSVYFQYLTCQYPCMNYDVETEVPSVPGEHWVSSPGLAPVAAQDSVVSDLHMGGTGSALNYFGGLMSSESLFLVQFELDEAAKYVFTGTLTQPSYPAGTATAGLCADRDCASQIQASANDAFETALPFAFEGVLPAGRYWLRVAAETSYSATVSFAFDFDAAPVPEPSLLLLMGVGLALSVLIPR